MSLTIQIDFPDNLIAKLAAAAAEEDISIEDLIVQRCMVDTPLPSLGNHEIDAIVQRLLYAAADRVGGGSFTLKEIAKEVVNDWDSISGGNRKAIGRRFAIAIADPVMGERGLCKISYTQEQVAGAKLYMTRTTTLG